jgi:hypothetical protein
MSTSDSQELIQELAKDLARCRQNRLLSEGEFIRFCKKREIPVWGVVTGDPSLLQNRGLLREDSRREDGSPLYHPFRFYIIYVILESLRNPLSRSSYLGLAELSFPGLWAYRGQCAGSPVLGDSIKD